VVEDTVGWKRNRLYSFGIKDKKVKRLTWDDRPVSSYSVSPGGRYLVYTLSGSPHQGADAQPKSPTYLLDLQTEEKTQIARGLQTPRGFEFTSDSKGLYFSAELSSDPYWNGAGIGELYYLDVASKRQQQVDLKWELGIGGGFKVIGNDVWVSLANRATRKCSK